MPTRGRYSFAFRFSAEGGENASRPQSDTYYTLNVLLGLSRVNPIYWPSASPVAPLFRDCCEHLLREDFVPYAYGMALWAGAVLGLDLPAALIDLIRGRLLDDRRVAALTAQDIGVLTVGATALAKRDATIWRSLADRLVERIAKRYFNATSGLFYNRATGLRRNFSSFASQTYCLLALYHYGEAFDEAATVALANSGAARLIRRQGPQGEWPWFYDVAHGTIADFYEVYSVHQHAMAPAFLHLALKHGVSEARGSIVAGFEWLFGRNQLGVSMLRPGEHLFYRSQLRRGEYDSKLPRVGRSILNHFFNRGDTIANFRALALRRECRSYELGLLLWSFGDRSDYPELTHRREFSV